MLRGIHLTCPGYVGAGDEGQVSKVFAEFEVRSETLPGFDLIYVVRVLFMS